MTNPNPHGQVPEALRIADDLEASSHFPGNMRSCNNAAAAELRRQHTRIAELESELEAVGAGGVQALSAAPARPTVEQVEDEVSMGHGAWDMVDPQELIGAVLRLAASPTPPAEQQVQTGAVYAELPAPNLPRGGFPDLFTEGQMRDFADRTHAMRMQAAPKAAPGEQQNCGRCCGSGEDPAGYYDQSRGDAGATFGGPCRECNGTGAAPQQEAQEPAEVPYQKLTNEIDLILSDPDTELSIGAKRALLWMRTWVSVPLYTAPQPAPAPLSDDVVRDAARWRMVALIGNEVMLHPEKRTQAAAVKAYMDATHSGSDLTGAVDAALAAQGGKA